MNISATATRVRRGRLPLCEETYYNIYRAADIRFPEGCTSPKDEHCTCLWCQDVADLLEEAHERQENGP